MVLKDKMKARKASWLAFGLVAFALFASAETDVKGETKQQSMSVPEFDAVAEGNRAYNQAMNTLSTLQAHIPSYGSPNEQFHIQSASQKLLTSIRTNVLQGPGPLGNFVRAAIKVQEKLLRKIGTEGLSRRLRRAEDVQGKSIKVIDLLQYAVELGSMDALYTLAQVSLFPPNIYFPSDPELAYTSLQIHASHTGNATSQSLLAFFHATGYRQIVPVDQAKAQLYFTFAAQGGDKGAQMALGYRHWTGIAANEDCGKALLWYQSAAQQAMDTFNQGPPGGRTLPLTPTRISDLAGGPYGPGASVASTGFNAYRPAVKAGSARAVGETWEDVVEYYKFMSDRGETDFAYRLAKIFYQGSIYAVSGGIASGAEGVGAVPRNFKSAHAYFLHIARIVWPHDPPHVNAGVSKEKEEGVPVGYAASSCGYLGRMYMRGEGVKKDFKKAKLWFERGANLGDKESRNGLAIILRDGLVGKPEVNAANTMFAAAAAQDLAESHVNLGKNAFYRGDFTNAIAYFDAASRHGSPFEAYYYLGLIQGRLASQSQATGASAGACAAAVSFHKIVAERGTWGDNFLRDAEKAWDSETERGKEMAMLKWWIAAERGSEIGQSNLAYVLDQDKSLLRLTRFSNFTPSKDVARLALTQWTRAAAQRNVDALVKVGDYHYHGLGDPSDDLHARNVKAVKYYQAAADTQQSALAMWNLGWMYENGVGVPQDFHLAKRYYDMAKDTNSEAYIPVVLSLVKLHVKSLWHTMQGGTKGLNVWSTDDEEARKRAAEKQKVDGSDHHDDDSTEQSDSRQQNEEAEDDGPWYIGKAKDDLFKKARQADLARNQEEDPVEWARERRQALNNEIDGEYGPEDYFEGAMLGGTRGEIAQDEMTEFFFLFGILAAVVILMIVRQRLADRIRRQEAEIAQLQGGVDAVRQHLRVQPRPAFPQPDPQPGEEWHVL